MIINIIVIGIFIVAIVVSFKYKFVQFKAFNETRKVLVKEKNKSAYSTFMVSLASHIGTGNIVGISTALIYGGAGALFWMWVFTVFTSIFSLIENTLAQVYKERIDGEYRGGACYYIRHGLNNQFLALLFSVFLVLSNTIFFQPLQVNTISETINITFGIEKMAIFVGFILFTYFIIFKGTKRIVKFSEAIVPIMSICYFGVTIAIMVMNYQFLPNVFKVILREAFDKEAILAGGIGSCLLMGFRRSLFSNEAGLGTMPTISAMTETVKPVKQGYVSVIGVFVDTIVMCSLTGFVILIYDMKLDGFEGADLILYIFERTLGGFGKYMSVFFLLSFATATVVSEFYLGESNLLYLINKKGHKKLYVFLYKCLFLTGIFIGVTYSTKEIFQIVDNGMVLLGVFNIYAILKLRKVFEIELLK